MKKSHNKSLHRIFTPLRCAKTVSAENGIGKRGWIFILDKSYPDSTSLNGMAGETMVFSASESLMVFERGNREIGVPMVLKGAEGKLSSDYVRSSMNQGLVSNLDL